MCKFRLSVCLTFCLSPPMLCRNDWPCVSSNFFTVWFSELNRSYRITTVTSSTEDICGIRKTAISRISHVRVACIIPRYNNTLMRIWEIENFSYRLCIWPARWSETSRFHHNFAMRKADSLLSSENCWRVNNRGVSTLCGVVTTDRVAVHNTSQCPLLVIWANTWRWWVSRLL